MNKFLFTIITLAFAFTFQIHAQSKVSSVYLKNGSIIKGTVTQSNDTSQVKIQSENGSVIFASKDDIIRIEQDDITVSKNVSDNGSIGAGFGIQYGVLGINFDIALSNYISFSAGAGHTILADVGYNGGFKLFFCGPENVWRPRIGIFYGVNGILDVIDLYEDKTESYRGFTIYAGQQWMFGETKSHGFDLDIVFLLTSGIYNKYNELKDSGYIITRPGFVKISAGYRFAF